MGETNDSFRDTPANAAVLQRLVHSHSLSLQKYIEKQLPKELKGIVEAQDVLQETFFKAFLHWEQFTPEHPDAARRWLMTIARNELLQLLRSHHAAKRWCRRATREELKDKSMMQMLHEFALYRRTPSGSAAAHELLLVVEQSLQSLVPNRRDVVRLRFLEGLSIQETAVKLRRTERAVEMASVRGLRDLRKLMRSTSVFLTEK